jgi:glycosyltransferase involved in cell wall biosynthesis
MQSVLIVVGSAFPPAANAGLHRVLGWVHHLPDLGWKVKVLTLPADYWPARMRDDSLVGSVPEGIDVVRVAPRLAPRFPRALGDAPGQRPRRDARGRLSALARWGKDRALFPDSRVLWAGPAARAGSSLALAGAADVVLTTSPERSSHLVGMRMATSLGIPWVADFRDPWEASWEPPPTRVHARALRRLGRAVASRARLLTAVSESLARQLCTLYGVAPEKVAVIPNGVDERTVARTAPRSRGGHLIVHTGRFYGRRSPAPFLRAVRALMADRTWASGALEVRLVGSFDDHMAAALAPFLSESWLRVEGEVAHAEALAAQRRAGTLLLVPGEDSHTVPGKLFEYLAARRPVLALCSEDSESARLLREEGAGIFVDPADGAGIRRALEEIMSGEGPQPLDEGDLVSRFGRAARAAEMSASLEQASSGGWDRR